MYNLQRKKNLLILLNSQQNKKRKSRGKGKKAGAEGKTDGEEGEGDHISGGGGVDQSGLSHGSQSASMTSPSGATPQLYPSWKKGSSDSEFSDPEGGMQSKLRFDPLTIYGRKAFLNYYVK